MRKYWILAAVLLAGLGLAGCNADCEGDECVRTCANLELTFDPPPGMYPESQQIEVLIDSNPPATMYFTLDGTIPEKDQANTFAFPTPISGIPVLYDNMPIRYFVECEDITTIPEAAVYGLDGPAISAIDPPPGLYAHTVSVSITANEEAEIVYTTDDSPPDKANPNAKVAPSPLKGIEISTDTTIKFSSVDTLGNVEDARVARYEIDVDPPLVALTPQTNVNYDGEVEVEIRATNEIAYMWYTLNGGIPVEGENSPGTKTRFASLPYKATFTETTVLRYIVVDRVGNREEGVSATGYKEAVFYVNCKPTAVATPPGGVYSQTEMDVELDVYPESGVGKFIRDGTGGTQTYSTPIAIVDTPTAELEIWAESNMQLISGCQATPSIVEGKHRLEEYLLGGESALYSYNEEFTTNTYIDSNATTAVVDLDLGVVKLPFQPPERAVRQPNNTQHAAPTVALARVADAPVGYTGLSDYFFVTEGPANIFGADGVRTSSDVPGLKVYKHSNILSGSGTPSLSFTSAYESSVVGGGPFLDVATVLASDSTPLVVGARGTTIEFFSVNVTDELVYEGEFSFIGTASPVVSLLNNRGLVPGNSDFLYFSYAQGADTILAAYAISDATTYQFENSIIYNNTAGPVDMVLSDPAAGDLSSNGSGGFVLHNDCTVSSMTFEITGAVVAIDEVADVCGASGTPVPYQIDAFQADADTYFTFVAYVLAGEIQVAVSEWQFSIPAGGLQHVSTKSEMLPDALPGALVGGMSIVPHPSLGNGNVLLLGAPNGLSAQDQSHSVLVYDLYATTNEFINRYGTANARLEALGSLALGVQQTAFDFVIPAGARGTIVSTYAVPPNAGGGVPIQGGMQVFKLDPDIRLRAQTAVATSYNFNPVSRSLSTVIINDPVRASGNIDGSIDLEVKIGDGSYQSVATPAQLGVSDGSNEVRWRATLDKGLDSQSEGPILDRLEIQLLYENED